MRFAGDQMPWRHYGAPVSSGGFEEKAAEAGMEPAAFARYVLQRKEDFSESMVEAARFAENDISWELPDFSE